MTRHVSAIIFSSLFIFCSSSSQRVHNDLKLMNLKGKVKSIIETYYPAKQKSDGDLEKISEQSSSPNKLIYSFNESGNLTEMSGDIPSDGLGAMRHEYKYDENGRKNEWIIYNDDGTIQGKSIYKYDDKGMISEENRYSQGWGAKGDVTYQGKFVYKYDELGNKIETSTFRKDGTSAYTTTYKYDKNGFKIEEKSGNRIIQYKNDVNGNPIEIKLEDIQKYSYKYDDKNNWIVKKNLNTIRELTFIIEREISYY